MPQNIIKKIISSKRKFSNGENFLKTNFFNKKKSLKNNLLKITPLKNYKTPKKVLMKTISSKKMYLLKRFTQKNFH